MRRGRALSQQGAHMPQFASLADIEAALSDGRLSHAWELLVPEKMVRDKEAPRVLSMLEQRGVAVTVSPHHYGDAIASRAERRPA